MAHEVWCIKEKQKVSYSGKTAPDDYIKLEKEIEKWDEKKIKPIKTRYVAIDFTFDQSLHAKPESMSI
jgi:hypothetical protein